MKGRDSSSAITAFGSQDKITAYRHQLKRRQGFAAVIAYGSFCGIWVFSIQAMEEADAKLPKNRASQKTRKSQ